MDVRLAYGRNGLDVSVPDDAVVVRPRHAPALSDEAGAMRDALARPVAGPPLRELVRPGMRIVICFPDITRPMPSRTVLPPLLAELEEAGARPSDIELVVATGTHRPATEPELRELVGDGIVERYQVRNHVATDPRHTAVGTVDGVDVLLDSAYVDADLRIVTGFVEPHFFAGYSGGPKAVCPGVAGLETIMEAHSPSRIASADSTWLRLHGNPVHDFIRAAVSLAPPAFSIDVVIDDDRRLAAVYAGELEPVHRAACAFVDATAIARVPGRFDVVVSTNGGYPLDRNLYQAVKGMAAAERVVAPGGTIVMAAECCDGLPEEGLFASLLDSADGADALVDARAEPALDRWQVQVLGRVLKTADVALFSEGLTEDEIARAHLRPVADVDGAVAEALDGRRGRGRVCVLPLGPLTVATAV